MTGRESGGGGMRRDVVDTKWLGIVDEMPEHATTVRERHSAQIGAFRLSQPRRDEGLEILAGLVQHPQGAVPCADQFHRGGDDAPQHGREIQFPADGRHRAQQTLQPVLGVGQGL